MGRHRGVAGLLVAGAVAVASIGVAAAALDDPIARSIEEGRIDIALQPLADGFTTPVSGVFAPRDHRRLFVVDQVGKVWAVTTEPGLYAGVPERHLFLDVGVDGLDLLVPLGAFGPGTFDERGLLGLAFHPDYHRNGLLYTYTSEPVDGPADFSTMPPGEAPNHQSVVSEWTVPDPSDPTAVVAPDRRVLMRIDQPQFNHNAGALVVDDRANLYIAVGDGGNADDQGVGHAVGGNGQDLSPGNVLGKILRIRPDRRNAANGQYGIPVGNPFIGTDAPAEIYAYGFRNPYRMSLDPVTNRLFVGDVGQNDIEEVDIVRRGRNYGWPVKEGSFLFDMNGDDPGMVTERSPGLPAGLTDPVAEYDHDEGVSVTGGYVYRGEVDRLYSRYVFADYSRDFSGPGGRLFYLDGSRRIHELIPEGGPVGRFVTGFGQDLKGDVYVLSTENVPPVGETGTVAKIVAPG